MAASDTVTSDVIVGADAPTAETRNILFATATCPNCKIACAFLDKAGFPYEKLLAEDNAELATQLGIRQAPTLVVIKDGVVEKYAGVSDIKKFLNA